MTNISRDFFLKPTPAVARALLGCELTCHSTTGSSGGIIVETEAYLGGDDPAAHSYRGETPRTKAMFGEPGHIYVYFIYGMHTCLNVVTGPVGTGHAVLIRALEPTVGVELMKQRRGRTEVGELCSGPAKLAQALGVTLSDNGSDLLANSRFELSEKSVGTEAVVTTTRIGIKKGANLPLRFYIKGSPFVSKA